MLVPIKFKQSWRGYNAGETASFHPQLAGEIVESDVAEQVLLEDIRHEDAAEKQAGKDRLRQARAERIRESGRYYDAMLDSLDPETDQERIVKIEAEKAKMATLIAESKGPAIYTRNQK